MFSGMSSGNIIGGVGCLILFLLFGFLTYRTLKQKSAGEKEIITNSTSSYETNSSFANLNATPSSDYVAPVTCDKEYGYEFVNITLSGVTYQNDDGTDRQFLLRRLHFRDTPFDESIELSVKECRFNDEIAFSVLANNLQIGFIPKSQVNYVSDNFNRIVEVTKVKVYGGGHDKQGNVISYGASITLKLRTS